MNYCPYCLRRAEGDFCPHCGESLHYQAGETQLPAGSLIESKGHSYMIGAVRGQGGFGITYAALDRERQTRVAVKEYFPVRCAVRGADNLVTPKPGMEGEFEGGFQNFCREADRLVGIKPLASVVHIWNNISANGTAYIVMEYLDGMPLHQKVSQMGGTIPAQELLPKLLPLMKDLEQLHAQGVLHRDISPDNILWMQDGTLKLIDFGSSRSMEGDRSMTVMLKPGFAPVEQYLTHGQGPWTDVYGLGATIYYCLTGIMPPPALERLEDSELKLPTSVGAAISPEEEQAIIKAMATQPKERFQSMREFWSVLYPEEHSEAAVTLHGQYSWTMPKFGMEEEKEAKAAAENAEFMAGNPVEAAKSWKKKYFPWLIGLGAAALVIAVLWFTWILSLV